MSGERLDREDVRQIVNETLDAAQDGLKLMVKEEVKAYFADHISTCPAKTEFWQGLGKILLTALVSSILIGGLAFGVFAALHHIPVPAVKP